MIVELAPVQLEQLAQLVADRLRVRRAVGSALVDVQAVAEYLAVDADFVYRHADELGVRRLGEGRGARLRFDLAEVDEKLRSCHEVRESDAAEPRRRQRLRRTPVDVEPDLPALVPIRDLIGEGVGG